MNQRQAGPIATIVIGLIMTAVGIGVCYFGKPILDDAKASESWPKTAGKVVSSKLRTKKDSDGDRSYTALVDYRYEVEGKDYDGDTIWFGQVSSNRRSSAQKVVSKYPKGSEIDVFYNPDDPAISVLEPGAFFSSYLLFGAGLLFAGIGILVLLTLIFKILLVGTILVADRTTN